jgi:NADP-dependent 3-hydroxy acid dehydrogenase YdfG
MMTMMMMMMLSIHLPRDVQNNIIIISGASAQIALASSRIFLEDSQQISFYRVRL